MNKELLQEAAKSLSIVDVFIINTHAYLKEEWIPFLNSQIDLEVQFRNVPKSCKVHNVNSDESSFEMVEFCYDVGIRFINNNSLYNKQVDSNEDIKEKDDEVLAEITATFCCVYRKDKDSHISQEALTEFAKYNVGYHVWPYWREYSATMIHRLRLPSVILPLYKLPNFT